MLLLAQLLAGGEVAGACADIVCAWEPLAAEWRKVVLAAHGAGFLPACLQVSICWCWCPQCRRFALEMTTHA